MPDQETKKNQHKKGKNEPKEQRRPRQQRNQSDRKVDKRLEESRVAAPEKPAYVEPGPDFYKGLKRETDDILKITEEANSKYKKKEIQSNWAKYEVPIESYDEVEEQENMGADYEKLIQAPLSLGGHFQFKHEKSWDTTSGPSLYDKYFDITMNDLATALYTIPFYERNSIDKSIFTETEIQTMDQRTSRYKHKYFKVATAESEIQDKLCSILNEDFDKIKIDENIPDERDSDIGASYEEISFDESKISKTEDDPPNQEHTELVFIKPQNESKVDGSTLDEIENVNKESRKQSESIDSIESILETSANVSKISDIIKDPVSEPKGVNKVAAPPSEPTKKPVIESPEDLEKWLDDFLDE